MLPLLPFARQSRRGTALAVLASLILGAALLTGCSRGGPAHLTAASASPSPTANAAAVARAYLSDWQAGRFSAMYGLISPESQQQISAAAFSARYQAIDAEATITSTTIDFSPSGGSNAGHYSFRVTFTTALFGPLEQSNTLPLVHDGASWRVQWAPTLIFKQLAGSDLIHLDLQVPRRGSILDRHGQPLATDGSVPTIGTSKELMQSAQSVPDPSATIASLAQKLGLTTSAIEAKIDDPSTPANYFIPLKTLAYSTPASEVQALQRIPGVLVEQTERRIYPYGSLGAQTIGYMAPITAEQLAKLRSQGYQDGDYIGQTGLEATYESVLAGRPDATLEVIAPDGTVQTKLAHKAGAPAQDVVTSLDVKAMQAAQKALGTRAGSVTVIDPQDNSVLALVSQPSFDPNAFITGLSQQEYSQLENDPNRPFLNRPVLATYPPGSTFKVITTAAGIDKGGFTPTTELPCTPVWYGLGQNNPKHNWTTTDNEPLTIAEGLMRSCDPVFYQIGLTLNSINPNILPQEAAGFGVGKPTGINGLEEAAGIDPSPAWKKSNEHQPWYAGDSVNMSIGQGFVLMTPLQIANMFSAIAANGNLRSPLLVMQTRPAGTTDAPTKTFTAKSLGKLPISTTALSVIQQGMRMVVQDPRGTAYSVFAGSGLDAAGKSGTAEDIGKQNNLFFVAYAPRPSPQAIVLTELDRGEFGSEEAGPITRDVLKAVVSGG